MHTIRELYPMPGAATVLERARKTFARNGGMLRTGEAIRLGGGLPGNRRTSGCGNGIRIGEDLGSGEEGFDLRNRIHGSIIPQ